MVSLFNLLRNAVEIASFDLGQAYSISNVGVAPNELSQICCIYNKGARASLVKEIYMNKDQVKGAVKETAGKVQTNVGRMTGSEEHEAKGLGKQVEGNVQKNVGNLKEDIRDVTKKH